MYRIGCFRCLFNDHILEEDQQHLYRDDVVFFIFLYQRYIYKMDPTRLINYQQCWTQHSLNLVTVRVNEFGVSAEMLEKKEVEGSAIDQDTSATPAIEGCDPEGDEGVQEAPKAKPKSKKAKKVD